jgi:hypothetical protein
MLGLQTKKKKKKNGTQQTTKEPSKRVFFFFIISMFSSFLLLALQKALRLRRFQWKFFQPFFRCFDINHQLGVKN